MLLKWLDGRNATEVGNALADEFVLHSAPGAAGTRRSERAPDSQHQKLQQFFQRFLQRVDHEAGPLRLNFFQRAKLANSFKWRLLEKGVEPAIVNELTEALVRRLNQVSSGPRRR
jgi:hypothetical protein